MKNLNLKYIDRPFWLLFTLLIVVAIVALFSASSTLAYEEGSMFGPVLKQIVFIIFGAACAFGIQFLPTWLVRLGGYALLIFSIFCLYLIIIPGSPFAANINDASRWFKFGAFSFQPSELAKLSLIIVVADLLARIKRPEDNRRYFFITLGITAVTVFPILIGNLSTAVLLSAIVFLLWFLARINWKYLVSTLLITATVAGLSYSIVEYAYVRPHRQLTGPFQRAITWVSRIDSKIEEIKQSDEEFRLTDANYQSSIAKVAIARGGKSPFGVLPGNSQERDFLPLAYADYIFAIIVEETGIIGAIALCFLYLAILFRACYASSRYADYSAMLMVMGLALMLTCQAFVSMAVACGIGAVTGQPLPLISKGGTGAIITSLYFGVMMCVAREQNELREREQQSLQTSIEQVPELEIE